MIAFVLRFVLHNLPALLFVVALLLAAARHGHGPAAERFLSWILLLPIGVTGLWAGAFHVFLPERPCRLSADRSAASSSRSAWPTWPSVSRPASLFGAI